MQNGRSARSFGAYAWYRVHVEASSRMARLSAPEGVV